MVDWGDGQYEQTAVDLWSASERAVALAGLAPSERVLDLACGTGNAALIAARLGAKVTGIDLAARLLEVAHRRLTAEKLSATFLRGDAESLPVPAASFDVVLSVFGLIFAPDAESAVAEVVRVVRPGGRVVLTSWMPTGTIAKAGRLVHQALTDARTGEMPAPPRASAWGDPAFVRAAFTVHGAAVEISEETLTFEAASPDAWFSAQERFHPVWRRAHQLLAASAWDDLRARSLAVLSDGNEAPERFRTTSRYLLARAVLPARAPAS